jgi:hypothetical protein
MPIARTPRRTSGTAGAHEPEEEEEEEEEGAKRPPTTTTTTTEAIQRLVLGLVVATVAEAVVQRPLRVSLLLAQTYDARRHSLFHP